MRLYVVMFEVLILPKSVVPAGVLRLMHGGVAHPAGADGTAALAVEHTADTSIFHDS